ncbi:hypothetical protein ACFQV2_25090 [Actinokineospora soli]|uniref:Uncharacterized protein n=1 Tax=Actinokineospora soli TaxID=1048753 RepID=A0ABW2TS14_9PSEU
MRLLASGTGELADFAREVLTGRVTERALLYSTILTDTALNPARSAAEAWHHLPHNEQQAIVASAVENTWSEIDTLNTPTRPTPPPPPDDEDEERTFLTDAW